MPPREQERPGLHGCRVLEWWMSCLLPFFTISRWLLSRNWRGEVSSFPSADKQLLMVITRVICMNKLSFSFYEKFVCMILRLLPREILRYWGLWWLILIVDLTWPRITSEGNLKGGLSRSAWLVGMSFMTMLITLVDLGGASLKVGGTIIRVLTLSCSRVEKMCWAEGVDVFIPLWFWLWMWLVMSLQWWIVT